MRKIANKAANPKIEGGRSRKEPLGSKKQPVDLAENAWPAEGPHARADLINDAATPGTGLFSNNQPGKIKVDPGAG